jgi:hypothetical protein
VVHIISYLFEGFRLITPVAFRKLNVIHADSDGLNSGTCLNKDCGFIDVSLHHRINMIKVVSVKVLLDDANITTIK